MPEGRKMETAMAKKISDEISDELREWCESENGTGCGGFVTKKISDELREFADAEVLDAIQISTLKRMANYIDYKMVELPLSADGYVWTGREECFWTGPANEDRHKFDGLHYADGMWCVEDVDFERYPAVSVWYERPDSLDRIVDDIETFGNEADINDTAVEFLCKIQERIYMLAKKDGQK